MKKVYVGFSRRKGWNVLSKLITLAERSQFSHAYVKLQVADRTVVYQASGLEVNFQNVDIFNSKEVVFKEFELDISDEAYNELLNFSIDNVGLPYGMMELIGVGLMKLFNLQHNPFPGKNSKFICVKLAAKVVEVLGIKVDGDLDSLDLNDLYKIMEANCGQ